jgi:hypothetical protein
MARRGSLLALALGAGLAIFALRSAVAYDFERCVVLDGFDASRWTWLLAATGGLLAVIGLVVRRDLVSSAAIVNSVAAACIALAIVWTVRTTPHRPDRERNEVDCSNQNIGIGCRAHQMLDALEPGPLPDAPSRALLIVALGVYATISITVAIRSRAKAKA